MITQGLDRIRIITGNSKCPLSHKCSGYDDDNDNCVTYRGRTEIGGDRAECYNYFKPIIRKQKEGLAGKIMKGILNMEGLDE